MLQLQAKSEEQRIRRDLSSTTAEINKRLAEEKRLRGLQVRGRSVSTVRTSHMHIDLHNIHTFTLPASGRHHL
jgi:hypothetical protein